MAKKLIHKYTFTPSSNTIVIPEIIKQSRFLLITNMTDGITIFTFNSQTEGYNTYTIKTTAKTTKIVLDKDDAQSIPVSDNDEKEDRLFNKVKNLTSYLKEYVFLLKGSCP